MGAFCCKENKPRNTEAKEVNDEDETFTGEAPTFARNDTLSPGSGASKRAKRSKSSELDEPGAEEKAPAPVAPIEITIKKKKVENNADVSEVKSSIKISESAAANLDTGELLMAAQPEPSTLVTEEIQEEPAPLEKKIPEPAVDEEEDEVAVVPDEDEDDEVAAVPEPPRE